MSKDLMQILLERIEGLQKNLKFIDSEIENKSSELESLEGDRHFTSEQLGTLQSILNEWENEKGYSKEEGA